MIPLRRFAPSPQGGTVPVARQSRFHGTTGLKARFSDGEMCSPPRRFAPSPHGGMAPVARRSRFHGTTGLETLRSECTVEVALVNHFLPSFSFWEV